MIDWDSLFSPTFASRLLVHLRESQVWQPAAIAIAPMVLLVAARLLFPRRRMLRVWIACLWIAVSVPAFVLGPNRRGPTGAGVAFGAVVAAMGLAMLIGRHADQP